MKWPLATLILLLVVRTAADELTYSRKEVIYGRTYGLALTMDVFTPRQNANGAGVIVCVSEGWYFPPTDFLNWGESGKLMLGTHPTVPVQGAFDFQRLDEASNSLRLVTDPEERKEIGKTVSPIYQVGRIVAPTLLVHGDDDQLIPLQQSQLLAAKLHAAGIVSDLIVMPGGGHDEKLIKAHTTQAMKWFDRFLAKQSEPLE